MTLRASTRPVPVAAVSVLLGAALCLGATPAHASDAGPAAGPAAGPVAGPDLPVETLPGLPQPHSGVSVAATIEDEEAWCGYLTGVYVYKPAYYSVRTINCRDTDVFVKPVYLNGTFGTCVLVPARHSRHLGGSVIKPMEESQIC
ncbi:hypothetical protein Cch01nite_36220 [Cellulomonas chitinilytica]|uniref:Secreted protein n=1 Tax=Cellulomonas chitinilytica TaxID=398759 RepID=A0A919U1A3_9CELL|nr:hypothetical protein [Cellulomonas chitinilytica]GIG22898.1 hypothetical protein Cch01nite_36220 [Cellulomonas chitinilytica]